MQFIQHRSMFNSFKPVNPDFMARLTQPLDISVPGIKNWAKRKQWTPSRIMRSK